ncbi:MAG: insulinase family protein [Candidatus Hydrogenedens sp.]|nr:insulinase family protein [Candidatus Hydrogenedens sp.]
MLHRCLSVVVASLVLLAVPAFAGYERVNTPDEADLMHVSIFKLDNGLTVYLTRNPEQPRFYTEIAVRAGSKMDPAESTGLAHYLEHILFKGTENMGTLDYEKEKPYLDQIEDLYQQHFTETDEAKRKEIYAKINEATLAAAEYEIPNEMDRLYKAMGGQAVNAHTWHEETVYKVDLPSNRMEQWALLETERFQRPVFRLFQPELEIVYEEMNRALDNKQRIIGEAVDELLYKKHPYGQQQTLGKVEHLKNPSLKNIGEFFRTYYVPNNMAVFISGDIDIDETINIIDEHFSEWKPKDVPETPTWEEAPLDGREYVETQYEGEEYVLLAFRTAPIKHEDADALMLIDMIMDNSTAGLINLNLNQSQKVRQAGSYPQFNNDYGAQYFYGVPKEDQSLEDVEKLLLEQIELLKQGGFEDWVLPAIINDFKKREKGGLEDNTARVSMMRDSWIHHISWDEAVRQIDRMEKVTKDDIVRVANKYFGENYVCGYRKDAQHEVPDIQKPELAAIEIDATRQSDFAKKILAMPVKPIEPVYVEPGRDYKKASDPKGRELYYAPNPLNDIFTFTIGVDFGKNEDNKIGVAIPLLDKSGTPDLSPEDLKKEWYKLATDFNISAGDDETYISISGLDENFEQSVKLLLSLVRAPQADAETLEQLKRIILQSREDAKKQSESIAAALVEYHRYGAESAFLRMLPTEQLEALTVDELTAIITGLLDYKHVATYAGSLPMERVQAILDEQMPIEKELKDPPPYRFRRAREVDADQIYFFDKDSAQATVRLEFGSVNVDEAMMPDIMLFNSYFSGGMAGLVFQELREARALAYSAGARYITGYRDGDQNLMVGAIATQADKTVDATKAFIELMDEIPESDERFAVARESIIQQYRTGKIPFREVAGAVRSWERLGLEPDPRKARFEAIENADMDSMLAFEREHIAKQPKLISIVGDKSKIGTEALAQLAPVEEIPLEKIFVE